MADNIRYIPTKVDDKPCVLCLKTCNFCPYLHLDVISKTVFCKIPNGTLYKKYIRLLYNLVFIGGYHYPTVDIPTPDWCILSKNMIDAAAKETIVFRKSDKIVVEQIKEIENLEIVVDKTVRYVGSKLITDITKLHNNEYKDEYKAPVPKNVCSCCGEDKTDVDRTKRLGMCEDCWSNLSKTDNEKVNLIYINNFRLKRKSTYSDTQFKTIKEVKI